MHNKYIYILNDKNSNTAVTLPNKLESVRTLNKNILPARLSPQEPQYKTILFHVISFNNIT